ncbi:Cyn operon transcriptional activator [Serratia fonticola]|uniref:Cyn operon transcriptional activator n=1 Tax=Serratia fonticola TaxID=47917 RepID=A0A4U9TFB3_SERFO|nr:Cyn operon transcriptional activator [Serratia fonticola]
MEWIIVNYVPLSRWPNWGAITWPPSGLCITQPALSKQIQAIELQLGTACFERGRQGARVTANGAALLPRARELLTQYEQFHLYAVQVVKGENRAPGLRLLGFPAFIWRRNGWRHFASAFPSVVVGLEDLPSERQCQLLLSGDLQAGFVRLPVVAPLQALPLLNDRLVLAAPRTMALQEESLLTDFHRFSSVTVGAFAWPRV